MAYRALQRFNAELPISRFEISKSVFLAGAQRLAGEPIPSGVSRVRLRQLYEGRRVQVALPALADDQSAQPETKAEPTFSRHGRQKGGR